MAIHPYILHNDRIRDAAGAELRAGQLGLLAGWGVFTTLRISEGVPFAWERHWARLKRDAALINLALPSDPAALEESLLRLVEANGRPDCTLRLVILRNSGGMWEDAASNEVPVDVIAMTADSKQWSPNVRLGIQPNARFAGNEFAGAKLSSWAHNLTWAERAHAQGLDEVVLLNQHGLVAECTSANIFAVFGNQVFTPPLADGCLSGITREVLLHELHPPGITVSERSLKIEDLRSADEVFITSTTRDLLPVSELDGHSLRPDSLRTEVTVREFLSRAFAEYLSSDIARRREALVQV
jgi:branched-chain amino acid aminotransferase